MLIYIYIYIYLSKYFSLCRYVLLVFAGSSPPMAPKSCSDSKAKGAADSMQQKGATSSLGSSGFGLGFRVWGLGFGVWGLGFAVSGFGL